MHDMQYTNKNYTNLLEQNPHLTLILSDIEFNNSGVVYMIFFIRN